MARRDIKSQVTIVAGLVPAARTASANGTGVDLAPYSGVEVVFLPGALTDGTHTPKVQESDDNSTFTDVVSTDQVGTLSALATNTVQRVGYIGTKRYIRPVVTVTGSPSTGLVGAAYVVCTNARKQPIS